MFTALEQIWADVRHAARSLAKNSGFTAVAILTLGLAIGANTAIFSVVDATLLRPLPYPDSDRLVAIRSVSPSRELPDGERTALGNLLDWQAQARSFEAIAGYRWRTVDLTGGNTSERLHGLFVTPGFFDVFGIRQIMGRAFIPQDHRAPMASFILGRDVWQRRFGSDPRLAGRVLPRLESGVGHSRRTSTGASVAKHAPGCPLAFSVHHDGPAYRLRERGEFRLGSWDRTSERGGDSSGSGGQDACVFCGSFWWNLRWWRFRQRFSESC